MCSDSLGKYIGVCHNEGGPTYEIIQTHGSLSQKVNILDEHSAETISSIVFRPIPQQYLLMKYSDDIKMNNEIMSWVKGDIKVLEKRINDMKERNKAGKEEWLNKMNRNKGAFMGLLRHKKV